MVGEGKVSSLLHAIFNSYLGISQKDTIPPPPPKKNNLSFLVSNTSSMQQLISSDPTTPAVCIDTPLVILNGMVCMQIENFKLCLFYNNNTWLQIGHKVILLGGESIRNIFVQGKLLEFLPWIKISNPTHAGCEIQSHDLPVTQWWCYHLV